MHLPLPVAVKIKEGFALYATGELDRDSPLYEVIHVAHCRYGGNSDLARLMLFRDIERNFERSGRYETDFSYKRHACCRQARKKSGLCKTIASLIADLGGSDLVTLTFS